MTSRAAIDLQEPKVLGMLLRTAREAQNLTPKAFATRLGLSAAQLCDLESGRRVLNRHRVAAILEQLGGYDPRASVDRNPAIASTR